MVSVGVSALGTTSIHFVEPDVKVNSQYYLEDLLMQKLLPDIRQLSDFYVFKQDSAPAQGSWDNWAADNEDPRVHSSYALTTKHSGLNPVDYKVSVMQEVYKKRTKDTNCVHVSWQLGMKWISALLMQQSDSGAHVFVHALKPKADTLNTHSVSNVFWRT